MTIRETDATLVKPVGDPVFVQAHNIRETAYSVIEAGMPAYLNSSGLAVPAIGTSAVANMFVGVSAKDLAANERGDFVGPGGRILCLTGATPGLVVYTMDTAGEIDHTGGTHKTVVGIAESATVLIVMPVLGLS